MKPAARGAVVAAGAVLNALVLLTPVLVAGRAAAALTDPAVRLFLVLATALYLADAAKDLRGAGDEDVANRAGGTHRARSVQRLALLTGLALLSVFWIGLVARTAPDGPVLHAWQMGGGAMILAGAALRWAAIARLGRFFVTELAAVPGQPLVTDGVYRLVRHPSETGTLSAGLGAAVLLGSWPAGVFWAAVLLPLVAVRVRREEKFLLGRFGDAFRHYRARTGGLVPRWPG